MLSKIHNIMYAYGNNNYISNMPLLVPSHQEGYLTDNISDWYLEGCQFEFHLLYWLD